MPMTETELEVPTLDGLELPATLTVPSKPSSATALLVHGGGGVNRHEWLGLFDRLAEWLANAGITSLRFDHRARIAMKDRSVELTLTGIANDISAARLVLREHSGTERIAVIGSSFGAGVSALWASRNATSITSLVLLYPLLDYKARLLEEKSWWTDAGLDGNATERLRNGGRLLHVSGMPIRRALLNEAVFFDPATTMRAVTCPTLLIHGTKDSRIAYEKSVELHHTGGMSELLTIEGADHGFNVPGDDGHTDPQTVAWQSQAFDATAGWITRHAVGSTQ